jgi:hypothetical protein
VSSALLAHHECQTPRAVQRARNEAARRAPEPSPPTRGHRDLEAHRQPSRLAATNEAARRATKPPPPTRGNRDLEAHRQPSRLAATNRERECARTLSLALSHGARGQEKQPSPTGRGDIKGGGRRRAPESPPGHRRDIRGVATRSSVRSQHAACCMERCAPRHRRRAFRNRQRPISLRRTSRRQSRRVHFASDLQTSGRRLLERGRNPVVPLGSVPQVAPRNRAHVVS